MKRKIIIDCDPGIDDSFALAYAFASREFDIMAVHTVAGNVNCDHTTRNARGVLGMIQEWDTPICKGHNGPMVYGPVFAEDVHGVNGLSGYTFSENVLAPLSNKSALESYVSILENTKEKITIIAVGPLTNLGILLSAYPHLKEKIEHISIMGGGIKGGNITIAGEFNYFADPHAAHIVMNSGISISMAGLDVTEKARMSEEDYLDISRVKPVFGSFLNEISQSSFAQADTLGYGRTTAPNDVVAVAYLIRPDLFKTKDMKVHVSYSSDGTRGLTYLDTRFRTHPKPNCTVLIDVDQKAFSEHVKEIIMKGLTE